MGSPSCEHQTQQNALSATLTYSYFIGSVGIDKSFPSAPKISEMLPGEESSGTYLFRVKNGVSPLEMWLKPQ
jgi:hypothetical protein